MGLKKIIPRYYLCPYVARLQFFRAITDKNATLLGELFDVFTHGTVARNTEFAVNQKGVGFNVAMNNDNPVELIVTPINPKDTVIVKPIKIIQD